MPQARSLIESLKPVELLALDAGDQQLDADQGEEDRDRERDQIEALHDNGSVSDSGRPLIYQTWQHDRDADPGALGPVHNPEARGKARRTPGWLRVPATATRSGAGKAASGGAPRCHSASPSGNDTSAEPSGCFR